MNGVNIGNKNFVNSCVLYVIEINQSQLIKNHICKAIKIDQLQAFNSKIDSKGKMSLIENSHCQIFTHSNSISDKTPGKNCCKANNNANKEQCISSQTQYIPTDPLHHILVYTQTQRGYHLLSIFKMLGLC